MKSGSNLKRLAGLGLLTAALVMAQPASKASKRGTSAAGQAVETRAEGTQFAVVEQPNAEGTKREFEELLSKYPPNLRGAFKEDPSLLTQEPYLATYPVLVNFLNAHPEIPLNPAFYLDGLGNDYGRPRDHADRVFGMWDDFLKGAMVFAGFAMAIGLLTWLIRTFIDFRRWNRLARVQAEVHNKLLDRFSTNEEVLAYINTPAGARFLQSAPISLGEASKNMGAPLSRIMWSLQAGVVLTAGGFGLSYAGRTVMRDVAEPLRVFGILAVALGVGFVISAAVAYVLSQKLGLFGTASEKRSNELQ